MRAEILRRDWNMLGWWLAQLRYEYMGQRAEVVGKIDNGD